MIKGFILSLLVLPIAANNHLSNDVKPALTPAAESNLQKPLQKTVADTLNPEASEVIQALMSRLQEVLLNSDSVEIREMFSQNPILYASGESPYGSFSETGQVTQVSYESFLDSISTHTWQEVNLQDVNLSQHTTHSDIVGIQCAIEFQSDDGLYNGYLFLLADLAEDMNSALITMFVWQPVESTEADERFGLDDLEIL